MKHIKKLAILLSVLLILVGCSASKTYISYTIYPIGYLLNRIGSNKINTISVQNNVLVEVAQVKRATEEEPGFKEIIDNSTYFFHIGELEPYLDIYGDDVDNSEANVIDLAVLNAIYKFKRYTILPSNVEKKWDELPYYDGDTFNTIDTYSLDLFLWLDPIGMLSMAKDIYTTLSSNYVEQSAFFGENYKKLESDLISLDAEYQKLSKKLKNENKEIKFVCMTPSFGSWQIAYGFQVYPVCLSKYGTLPNAEQLQIIKDRIMKDNVKYIAYEPNMTSEMTELFNQLESELGLVRVNLSNISSLTPSQMENGKDYLSLMYENLSVLENISVSINALGSEEHN